MHFGIFTATLGTADIINTMQKKHVKNRHTMIISMKIRHKTKQTRVLLSLASEPISQADSVPVSLPSLVNTPEHPSPSWFLLTVQEEFCVFWIAIGLHAGKSLRFGYGLEAIDCKPLSGVYLMEGHMEER